MPVRRANSATPRFVAGSGTIVIVADTSGIAAASSADRGSRARMGRELPESEWKVIEHPELRIIGEALWAAVQARRVVVRAHLPPHGLMRGRNAALHSRHVFSGFMRCGLCGGAIAVVSGGYRSPRYGCVRNSKQGAASCSNKLTIRAKVADAALLAGLHAFLREPHTIDALTNLLSGCLNAVITARPRLQALRVAERDVLRRKLSHLINAIEDGAATPALLNTMRTREKELADLDAELDALEEPLADRLAVIPSWVRRQVSDVQKASKNRSSQRLAETLAPRSKQAIQ